MQGEKKIIFMLKSFVRIFTNSPCAMEPSHCLTKLEHLEDVLRDHLLQQTSKFSPSTVEFMLSWGDAPMLGHWNLFAKEMQLYLPDPKQFISVPVSTINAIHKSLRWQGRDASLVLEELWDPSIAASALKSRGKFK